MIRIKRVYDPPEAADGLRVLVDRIWPRGLSKEQASIDLWLKQVAPSNELRRWFGHEPKRWDRFRSRYRDELKSQPETLQQLRQCAAKAPLTLVFGARDETRNNAVVLKEMLQEESVAEAGPRFSSPPCLAHEMDPVYAGYMSCEELTALLKRCHEEAEMATALVRGAATIRLRSSGQTQKILRQIERDAIRAGIVLASLIRDLGGQVSSKACEASGEAQMPAEFGMRIAQLSGTAARIVEALHDTLPRVAEDAVHAALKEVLALEKAIATGCEELTSSD